VIEELDDAEIEAFLREQVVGRIGCHAFGRTYVVPVIYAWDDGCVYVQTIEGRKVEMMRANPEVCFEIDEYHAGSWRSVIVDGTYEELSGAEAEHALAVLVERFARGGGRRRERATGVTPVAFRIRCSRASGRRVRRSAPQ
jgi:nitroimidazol reductase NimA-like FMN-containing flavoprotein (pyridoxamine 5'-phosphate oxidase superfamily)